MGVAGAPRERQKSRALSTDEVFWNPRSRKNKKSEGGGRRNV